MMSVLSVLPPMAALILIKGKETWRYFHSRTRAISHFSLVLPVHLPGLLPVNYPQKMI